MSSTGYGPRIPGSPGKISRPYLGCMGPLGTNPLTPGSSKRIPPSPAHCTRYHPQIPGFPENLVPFLPQFTIFWCITM